MKKNKAKKTYTKEELIKINLRANRVGFIVSGLLIIAAFFFTGELNWLELTLGLMVMTLAICCDESDFKFSDAEVKEINRRCQMSLLERLNER